MSREFRLRIGSKSIPIARSDRGVGGRILGEGQPQTFIDGGGTIDNNRFGSQEISRDQLIEYKEIRESGGPIAAILEAKGLLNFGTGSEWITENEDLKEWLEEHFPEGQRDLFFIRAGTDAFTYPGCPMEIVENRRGDFSHVEVIEPWTVKPLTNRHGDIEQLVQEVKINGTAKTQPLNDDETGYIVLTRSNGRDKTGVSLLERNRDEIEHYLGTRDAVGNSARIHGFPQRHIKVGREERAPPNDTELRRIRQRFSRAWTELTMFVTGRDVEIKTLEATNFDFEGLTEDAMKNLMLSFLLPQELANIGSDGLGSGMPAELRKELLLISIQAKQRDFAGQFVEQIVRPIIDEYSPFSSDELDALRFKEPLDDESDELDKLEQKVSIGEQAASAGLEATYEAGEIDIESGQFEADESSGLPDGGGGGLFSARRKERVMEQPGFPVSDASECDGQVIEGPQGGLRCIPADEGGGGEEQPGEDGVGVDESVVNEVVADLPDDYDGADETKDELGNAAAELAEQGATYTQTVEAIQNNVGGLDSGAERKVREQAWANQTGEMELAGQEVEASPVIGDLDRDVRVAAEEQLEERVFDPEMSMEFIEENGEAWFSMEEDTMLNRGTADMWALAASETGHMNTPDNSTVDLETWSEPTDEPREDLMAQKENTEEVLREMFGDTVPVARGVSGEFAEEIKQAREAGEPVELEHRTLESWSTFPNHAEEFAGEDGVIIQTEVPVEDVWMSSHTTPGLEEHENEIVVSQESVEYSPDEIFNSTDEGIAGVYDSMGN